MWHAASIYNFKATDSSPVKCQFCYVQYRSAFVQVGGMYKSTWILKIYFVYFKCDFVISLKQEYLWVSVSIRLMYFFFFIVIIKPYVPDIKI